MGDMGWSRESVERLDAWQQRHRVPGFAIAVGLRDHEDRGRDRGALLAYYGFISLFPLLLVLVTLLGIVLDDNSELRDEILATVYSRIPVIGPELQRNASSLESSGWVLLVALVVSLWSGLAVVRRAEESFNAQWGTPRSRRGFVASQARTVGALAVMGGGVLIATIATSAVHLLDDLPLGGRLLGALFAIVLNIGVLTVTFHVLLQATATWSDLYLGGIAGGITLWLLQIVGATYVDRVIVGASDVYGGFAIVLGLLVWIALLARVTLLASAINVVKVKELWPRSFSGQPTAGDLNARRLSVERDDLLAGRRA